MARTLTSSVSMSMSCVVAFLAAVACGGQEPGAGKGEGNGGSGGQAAGGSSGGPAGAPAFTCASSGLMPRMIDVPAGEFSMGCNAALDVDCVDDEKPLHQVTLSAFQIDESEVTQDQYAGCVLEGACAAPLCEWDCSLEAFPASCVDWQNAKAYCAWAGKQLPTEAQWEKAARGGDGRKYPWGNTEPTCNEVNMSGCGEKAEAVGSRPAGASPYGVLDMAGNVVEMLSDYYDAGYYQSSPPSDPLGPTQGQRYVGRGGGYKSTALWQRASSRDWYDPPDAGKALGFRCAR